jgi:putative hemolysin
MLVSAVVTGLSLLVISLLVALEVALLQSKRALIPDTRRPLESSDSEELNRDTVQDFVASARLLEAVLLLSSGAALGRIWGLFLSVEGRPSSNLLPHYLASTIFAMVVIGALVVLGYCIPSELAKRFPDAVIAGCAWLGRFTIRLMWPLRLIARLVGRLTIPSQSSDYQVEEDALETDIRSLVEQGERAGVIEEEEGQIINRVFKLGDKPVISLMTPYRDVVFLRSSMLLEEAQQIVLESRFSWYPLLHGDDNEVLGIVSALDVFELSRRTATEQGSLREVVTTALDIPDSLTALELLEMFREQGARFAVVRDEYGRIEGIATVEDVLKVIVGELGETDGEERSIIRRDDRSWLVDASSDVENLFEVIGCQESERDEEAPFPL